MDVYSGFAPLPPSNTEPMADLPAPFGDVMEAFDRINARLDTVSLFMGMEPMTRRTLGVVAVDLRSLASECEALYAGWPEGAGELRAGAKEDAKDSERGR